jgi:hypothetical protein
MAAKPSKLQFCAAQVKRLSSKPFFPSMHEGVQELVYVLNSCTKSEDHAERVISAAVLRRWGNDGTDRCPSPADIADLCGRVPATATKREASPDCRYCEGSGFEEAKTGGVRRCRCGGTPMSSESRLAQYARERAAMTPEKRAEYSAWADSFAAELRQQKQS